MYDDGDFLRNIRVIIRGIFGREMENNGGKLMPANSDYLWAFFYYIRMLTARRLKAFIRLMAKVISLICSALK